MLPEVKSNDGTTPSPSLPSAPSRISIHDVTKAFQQVPTSSSASSQPPSRDKYQISPPTTNAPVARPTPPTFSHPPMAHTTAYYPSPLMSHPPPATIMYAGPMTPSPVPGRIHANGAASMYNAWVVPGTQGNMMPTVAQPFGQILPYPSPGYPPQPSHAAQNLMRPPLPQTQGRGRGVQVMSPVLSPAHAQTYGGSPVMMHLPHQNHSYMPMSPDHQPLRVENGQVPPRPIPLHPHASAAHGFSPASPFNRPW